MVEKGHTKSHFIRKFRETNMALGTLSIQTYTAREGERSSKASQRLQKRSPAFSHKLFRLNVHIHSQRQKVCNSMYTT